LNTSKEVGLEVNKEKMKYVFMRHHQTTRQNQCTGWSKNFFAEPPRHTIFTLLLQKLHGSK